MEKVVSVGTGQLSKKERTQGLGFRGLLEGSWDLVTSVIIKVTILIITCNPN